MNLITTFRISVNQSINNFHFAFADIIGNIDIINVYRYVFKFSYRLEQMVL